MKTKVISTQNSLLIFKNYFTIIYDLKVIYNFSYLLWYKHCIMVCYCAPSEFMFSDTTFIPGGSIYVTEIGKHYINQGYAPPFPKLLLNQNPSTGFSVLPLPGYVSDQDIAFLCFVYFQIYKTKSRLLPSVGRYGLKEQGKPHL